MRATLQGYQDKVLAIADEADRLLREEGLSALSRITQLRVDQGVAMASYQLFVHREVFTPLIRDGSPTEIEAAKQLKVACIAFSNQFCHYVQEWARRDPAADWANYAPAARAMMADIRQHVAHVRETLAPALGRHERGLGGEATALAGF